MCDYIKNNDTIIFSPTFHKPLDINLIYKYKKIIFSQYKLSYELFDRYNNNNFDHMIKEISSFNQPINNLPRTITYLRFGCNFNKPVDNLIDGTIYKMTYLHFGFHFNQSVDKLPNSLTHLIFDNCFNQSVDKLPNSLTHLIFGDCFNYPVNNLPSSLTYLSLGYYFNKSLNNLPSSIIFLRLECCNLDDNNILNDSIEELELGFGFDSNLLNLPSSIKKISFDKESNFNRELNCLPTFIEFIQLPKFYCKFLSVTPIGLKKIQCHCSYPFKTNLTNKNIYVETYF